MLVDLNSTVDLGEGDNTVTATGNATDTGSGGAGAIAVTADGIENRGVLTGGGGIDDITGIAVASSQGGIPLTIAGGIDNGFGSTRNNIPVEPTLATGGGNDRLVGSGTVTALEGIGLASGIETSGTINTDNGDDELIGTGISAVTDGIRSVADGIENSDLVGAGAGGVINTGIGSDTLLATATATGVGTDAEAIAIRNDFEEGGIVTSAGEIRLGAGGDTVTANATALSDSDSAIAIGFRGGILKAGDGIDTVTGEGTATAKKDAQASGVAVRVADSNAAGMLNTGDQADTVAGTGTATTTGGHSAQAVANGVIVESGSMLKLGNDADGIIAAAAASGKGTVTANGIKNEDTLEANGGDDRILVGDIDDQIFVGHGNEDIDTLITFGAKATGNGNSASVSSDGIDNTGTIVLSSGNDTIEAAASAANKGGLEAIAIRNVGGAVSLGSGEDMVLAFADSDGGTAIGINGGTIAANGASDTIKAGSTDLLVGDFNIGLVGGRGFGGNVDIDMGGGDDFLLGFGQASADGGNGTGDTLAFEFTKDLFVAGGGVITQGDPGENGVSFAYGAETLQTSNFESFTFGFGLGGNDEETFDYANVILIA